MRHNILYSSQKKIISSLFFVYFFSFFLINNNFINSISYPVSPTVPTIKNSNSNKKNTFTKKNKSTTKIKKASFKVKILLASKDELLGKIYIPQQVTFTHYKNGLTYTKTLKTKYIKKIIIQRYKIKNKTQTKNKNEYFYEFEPSQIILKLTNKRTYYLSSLFSFLRNFSITTIDGRTRLFSFFGDTYSKKTGWKSVSSNNINYHLTNAHPQVAIQFTFVKNKEIEEEF